MKLLIRFFLSLCFLLSSGFSRLYTHTYADHVYTPQNIFERTAQLEKSDIADPAGQLFLTSANGTENPKDELEATTDENEDDKWSAFRKYLENNTLLDIFANTLIPATSCRHNKQHLPLDNPYSISPYRYIVLRVIRV
ncbi:hypothetical protein KTO58_11910 [Chitinophaga pendula]|uniref:hypothetical protein n=1 Tax=Chitinophaga TaxID=79328 RepID=UPI000BB01FAB|nr:MULTISPECIES: hypothetical protein [Chitinophaga]ASZ12529.1 hypothetical protein CK934_16975 [Chitinophaga sp. MD30]UCJ09867.1 hypothetical protein KTO58_11910 [Chitinophaga pendula]